MPTYEYRCKDCGNDLEVQQAFTDDALTDCPSCGGALKKRFGSVGISFKGSGFYKNDARGTSSSTSTSTSTTDAGTTGGDSTTTSGDTTKKATPAPESTSTSPSTPSSGDSSSSSSSSGTSAA